MKTAVSTIATVSDESLAANEYLISPDTVDLPSGRPSTLVMRFPATFEVHEWQPLLTSVDMQLRFTATGISFGMALCRTRMFNGFQTFGLIFVQRGFRM